MSIKIAPYDVKECEEEHSADAHQNANIFPSYILILSQKFITMPNISIAQVFNIGIHSINLLCLSTKINFRRNCNVLGVLSLSGSIIKSVVLN